MGNYTKKSIEVTDDIKPTIPEAPNPDNNRKIDLVGQEKIREKIRSYASKQDTLEDGMYRAC